MLTLLEVKVLWALTHPQVQKENERVQRMNGTQDVHPEHQPSSTAIMLARRAANALCLGIDAVTWLGSNALPVAGGAAGIPLFSSKTVLSNGVPADTGLTCIGGPNKPLEVLQVVPVNAQAAGAVAIPALYSVNTPGQMTRAVTDLAANGYGGPYVGLLPPYFYADSFYPNNSFQRPADLIIPILDGG
jgi:hypothetical protein